MLFFASMDPRCNPAGKGTSAWLLLSKGVIGDVKLVWACNSCGGGPG